MTDLFQEPDDATPLEPHDRQALRQSWITNRQDLNQAEEANLAKGFAWANGRRGLKPDDILTTDFVRTLHKQMFGDVWSWAGDFRAGDVNIGNVPPHRIVVDLPAMLDDVKYWVEHKTFPPDEIAVRLHHRLAEIHPFPNGNGRHARLMADLLIQQLGGQPFSWGSGSLKTVGELRKRYVEALKMADNHDIQPLIGFARS
ncbi:MAG TPA: mobile mystery protein B [Bradyrhizobium sp.]|jgi:Fic-DOC domain mobile mystery protein B|nr:mobile mystery protein B [Bradyrhizobium sp.]